MLWEGSMLGHQKAKEGRDMLAASELILRLANMIGAGKEAGRRAGNTCCVESHVGPAAAYSSATYLHLILILYICT